MNKSNFVFGTKAETLLRIKPFLSKCKIPNFEFFSVQDWQSDRTAVRQKLQARFPRDRLIVRSSAKAEDSATQSLPGIYDSVPDVDASDTSSLVAAIDVVCASYGKHGSENPLADHILVQAMIRDVSMSGVVFTQDMNTGAPYYVINYDDETGKTDTVTSGGVYSNRTLYVYRAAVRELRSERFGELLAAVNEIETITGSSSLDIEFAVGSRNEIYLFQARQITTHPNWNRRITVAVGDAIDRTREFVRDRMQPQAGVLGQRSLIGQMPDWNPAEMIGTAPRPLALSLYRRLITDSSWRVARRQMGYKAPKGTPLMYSLVGRPYIDVRLSFHSFLPEELNDSISSKLVDAWLDRLAAHKELNDKVEFEVAITSLDFEFDRAIDDRYCGLLGGTEKGEYRHCLFTLTDSLVTGKRASVSGAMARIHSLKASHAKLLNHQRLLLFQPSAPCWRTPQN